MRPLLLAVAYPPELRAIPDRLAERDGIVLGVVGVGPVAAAVGAAALFAEVRPRAAILVGTAGAYPGRVSTGIACVARSTRIVDAGATLGLAAIPRLANVAPRMDRSLLRALSAAGAYPVSVATLAAITTDDDLARRLGRRADVEHMETAAVAQAAAAARIPFAALLGIANLVGSEGRAQWKKGEPKALSSLRAVLLRAKL